VPTHHALARSALLAGKHVFVEKPLAWTVAEARELEALAAERSRIVMVGHLLRFHPAVVKLRELIESGELGDVLYVYGNRQILGVIREDENALWSLGVHDISVVLYLLGGRPVEVSARGECYLRPGVEDVVFGYLKLASGQVGHLHLSWLDPHKMRKMTVVGSKRMAVFDDMEADRKVTVYDKGPVLTAPGKISTHTGDITSPAVSREEPLRIECQAFLDAVRSGNPAHPANAAEGVAVVEVLEAMQRSLEQGGAAVTLEGVRA
jgi:predicted dehydrogenase